MRALEGVQASPNILAGFQTVDTKRSGTYQLSVHASARTTYDSCPMTSSLRLSLVT
jgi:hypothetical protein